VQVLTLETRSLNQDPHENTFGVICLHCGSNNNPTVGQFVDAMMTSIINGLAYTGLRNANCEGDDTEHLDNLHFLLKESTASQPNPLTSHDVTMGGPFMMVLVALALQSKCSRR